MRYSIVQLEPGILGLRQSAVEGFTIRKRFRYVPGSKDSRREAWAKAAVEMNRLELEDCPTCPKCHARHARDFKCDPLPLV